MSSKAPATSCHSVWPDVGIKSSPNFTNNAQKGATTVFTYRVMLFTVAQKISKYLGHFCKTICNQQLQKSPNLVTLVPSQRCSVGFSWGARRREEDGGGFFPSPHPPIYCHSDRAAFSVFVSHYHRAALHGTGRRRKLVGPGFATLSKELPFPRIQGGARY